MLSLPSKGCQTFPTCLYCVSGRPGQIFNHQQKGKTILNKKYVNHKLFSNVKETPLNIQLLFSPMFPSSPPHKKKWHWKEETGRKILKLLSFFPIEQMEFFFTAVVFSRNDLAQKKK